MPDEYIVLDRETFNELRQALQWQRNLRIVGPGVLSFSNRPTGASCHIGVRRGGGVARRPSESRGEFQGQEHYMVSNDQDGWDDPKYWAILEDG